MIIVALALYIIGANAAQFKVGGRTVRVSEVALIILGLLFLYEIFTRRYDHSVWSILLWGLWSCILIFCNSIIYGFGGSEILEAFLYLFRFLFSVIMAYCSAKFLQRYGYGLQVLRNINVMYLVVCAIGFVQLVLFPHALDWYEFFTRFHVYWIGGDPHIDRIVSTYFDPNYMSCCLLIGFTVNWYLLRRAHSGPQKSKRKTLMYFIFALIYILTIFLTKSRSGFLGFAVLCVLYLLMSVDYKHITTRTLIVAASIFLIGFFLVCFSNFNIFVRIRGVLHDPSAQHRFQSWQDGFQIMIDTNFAGIGYNLYGAYNAMNNANFDVLTGYGNDSSLVLILTTSGLLGTAFFVYHLISLWQNAEEKREVRSLLLAALVICNFNNLLFYSPWTFPFYFIAYLFMRSPQSVTSRAGEAERKLLPNAIGAKI